MARMSNPIQLAIHGAGGRMGRRVVALAAEDNALSKLMALWAPRGVRLHFPAMVSRGHGYSSPY